MYPEIFSSYISKFQSLVSRLANALSGQANHKIRTPQEPEKLFLRNGGSLCVPDKWGMRFLKPARPS